MNGYTMIKNRKVEKQITEDGHALSQVKLRLCDVQRPPSVRAAQSCPFGFGSIRHRAAMRCRAGLGPRLPALPARTSPAIPVASACSLTVRGAVRDRPLAVSQHVLRRRRGSADAPYPAALTGQNRAAALKFPPFMLPRFISCCTAS